MTGVKYLSKFDQINMYYKYKWINILVTDFFHDMFPNGVRQ